MISQYRDNGDQIRVEVTQLTIKIVTAHLQNHVLGCRHCHISSVAMGEVLFEGLHPNWIMCAYAKFSLMRNS